MLYTDAVTLAYVCGNSIRFLNTETLEEKYLHSPGDGIGTLATNPAYNIIAFSDVCIDAKIYIYELFSLENPNVVLEGENFSSLEKTNCRFIIFFSYHCKNHEYRFTIFYAVCSRNGYKVIWFWL